MVGGDHSACLESSEDLSFVSRILIKKKSGVVCACSPRAGDVAPRRSPGLSGQVAYPTWWVPGWSSLLGEF